MFLTVIGGMLDNPRWAHSCHGPWIILYVAFHKQVMTSVRDDEPCTATEAYGLSKWLMEEVVAYFHRQFDRLDSTLFRIGAVLDDATPPVDLPTLDSYTLPITQLGSIAVGDVITALSLAASHELPPDLRRANLVALNARTPIPTADALTRLLGPRSSRLDLSYYGAIDHQYRNVFAIDRLQKYFRFTPAIDVRTMRARDVDVVG